MLVGRPEAATGQKTTAKAAATNATTAAERVERRLPRLVALRILFTAFSPFAPARSAQLPRCGSSAAALASTGCEGTPSPSDASTAFRSSPLTARVQGMRTHGDR